MIRFSQKYWMLASVAGAFFSCDETAGFSQHHHQYRLSAGLPSPTSNTLLTRGIVLSTLTQGRSRKRCAHIKLASSPHSARTSLKIEAPRGATVLSDDPLVYVVPNLLTPDECNAYIHRVQALSEDKSRTMTRSNPPQVSVDISKLWPLPFLSIGAGIPPLCRLVDAHQLSLDSVLRTTLPPIGLAWVIMSLLVAGAVPLIRLLSQSSSRTSDAMAFNLEQDVNFVRGLVDRVCDISGHPWQSWEAPVVTRYEPGAVFSRHGDSSPTRGSEWSDLGGQRIVTCICYLNSPSQGGETSFDRLQLAVKPTQGSALVFFPADKDTLVADDRTMHESLPPADEKWIVQLFGRVDRVPPPLGLPASYATQGS